MRALMRFALRAARCLRKPTESRKALSGEPVECRPRLDRPQDKMAARACKRQRSSVDRLPAPSVPSYLELDLHLGWRPSDALELALIGRNLLHDDHEELGPAGPERELVERSLFGRVTWAF